MPLWALCQVCAPLQALHQVAAPPQVVFLSPPPRIWRALAAPFRLRPHRPSEHGRQAWADGGGTSLMI